jgi:hypothetical protein
MFHDFVHMNSLLIPILSHLNPAQNLGPSSFNVNVINIINKSIRHRRVGVSSELFPCGYPTGIVYKFLIFFTCANVRPIPASLNWVSCTCNIKWSANIKAIQCNFFSVLFLLLSHNLLSNTQPYSRAPFRAADQVLRHIFLNQQVIFQFCIWECSVHNIVTDLINALPGNSSVNTNWDNNRREIVFSMWPARGGSTEL